MDKEKEIEKMAKAIYETGVAIDGTDVAFGLIDDSHFERMARKLVAEGYGDVRAAVKEFAEKLKEKFIGYVAAYVGDTEIEFFVKHNETVRKNTAKDIFSWIYKNLVNMNFITGNVEISLSALDTFAKTYGVEIFDIFKQGGNNEHKL